jgi:hypothetical protein
VYKPPVPKKNVEYDVKNAGNARDKQEIKDQIKNIAKTAEIFDDQIEKLKTSSTLFDNCKENGEDCMLNKYEVCKKITHNYLYRLNILSAIYHILPRKTSDNKFTGSFYYNRILALKNGNMCIPKNIESFKKSTQEDKISFLNKILNKVDVNNVTCRELYKNSYTTDEIEKLKGDSEFSRKYHDIKKKMNLEYRESLEILYAIILKLKTDKIIPNSDLYDISELAKKTIDDMYYSAQFNYIVSILNYINYNTP